MNDAAKDKFEYEADADRIDKHGNTYEPVLKLPPDIRDEVIKLCELHDSSLDWKNAPDLSPDWTPERQKEFDNRTQELFLKICSYLGDEFEIYNDHDPKNWH